MPTTLVFRRGTNAPTSASGLTLGEPAFDSSLNRFYIGLGTGITAAWVGAGICGSSGGIAAGITYQVPTLAAVKDYISAATSGVSSLNSLTGAITISGGTNIGVTASGSSITVTNQGVQSFNGSTGAIQGVSSFNGLTGAVGGVCAASANTFTALQTFNSGITTSYIYASTGSTFGSTLQVNGGATFSGTVDGATATFSRLVTAVQGITTSYIYASTGSTFNSTLQVNGGVTFSGRLDVGGNFKVIGDTQLGDASTDALTVFAGTTFNNRTDFAGNNNFATGLTAAGTFNTTSSIKFNGSTAKTISTTQAALTISGVTSGTSNGNQNSIVFGVQTTDPLTLNSATGVFNFATSSAGANPSNPALKISTDDGVSVTGSVTIQPTTYLTAARTLNIQDASGTIALTSQLMGAINGSTAATTAVTSFNGLTGAVGGVCAAQANTFTAVQTFNSGVTFASTTDHTGAARFNGGLTASSVNVSGTLVTTGDATVGGTLTVSGNLQVNGTTTTINSTTLVVDDKLIELAHSPSGTTGNDAAVDGGGIQLNSTQGNKTFTWVDSTDSWTSNQNLDLSATYAYKIAGTTVLSSNSLGSGVTGSSLTAVGTLTTGVWQATAVGVTYGGTGLSSYTIGDVLYASGTGTLAKLSTTTAGYLLAANGAGAAPEYKQLLVRDAGANSIATVASGSGTLTATIQYATTSLKGVASFDSTNFTVSSGAVSITGIDGGTY